MNMTKLVLILTTCTAAVLSSCESSKIAFGNSYYFKQTPKQVAVKNSPEEEVVATIGKVSPDVIKVDHQVKKSLAKLATLTNENIKLQSTLLSEREQLTRLEKKSIRQERKKNQREIRKELKTLRKEYRSAPEESKESFSLTEVTGNLRTGIILGGAGLVLMIIGGYSILSTIGALLLVAGLVFILIDVL